MKSTANIVCMENPPLHIPQQAGLGGLTLTLSILPLFHLLSRSRQQNVMIIAGMEVTREYGVDHENRSCHGAQPT